MRLGDAGYEDLRRSFADSGSVLDEIVFLRYARFLAGWSAEDVRRYIRERFGHGVLDCAKEELHAAALAILQIRQ